jgi:hypothetical protein
MAIATITATTKTYLRVELLGGFGLSASDRFFLHLPDFVLSLSFDHLPFLTLGTGKTYTFTGDFSAFLLYIFNNAESCRSFLKRLTEHARSKLKLSLFSTPFSELPLAF